MDLIISAFLITVGAGLGIALLLIIGVLGQFGLLIILEKLERTRAIR